MVVRARNVSEGNLAAMRWIESSVRFLHQRPLSDVSPEQFVATAVIDASVTLQRARLTERALLSDEIDRFIGGGVAKGDVERRQGTVPGDGLDSFFCEEFAFRLRGTWRFPSPFGMTKYCGDLNIRGGPSTMVKVSINSLVCAAASTSLKNISPAIA